MEQKEKVGANRLFDAIKAENKVKNDAALARALETQPAAISNMRAGRVNISAPMIIRIMEHYGMSLPRLRRLLKGEE